MPAWREKRARPRSGDIRVGKARTATLPEQSPACRILTGSWRAQPDPLCESEASLAQDAPLLASTGAAALAWNRVARTPGLRDVPAAAPLRARARALALDSARHEPALAALAKLLSDHGFDALVFKGWAVAQHYAPPHLRPMGDVDLCASPGQFDALAETLRHNGFRAFPALVPARGERAITFGSPAESVEDRIAIDLQENLDRFFLPSADEVFARAVPRPIGQHVLLTPAAEDHLRLVAIHFLQHGGWRPLWLCDVAAMLETLPETFNWEICLGAEPRRRYWILCVLRLAHELLGARLDAVPASCRVRHVPSWLRRTVLWEWTKPITEQQVPAPFGSVLWQHPGRVAHEVVARWPNAIRSTVELDGAFTRRTPWTNQLLHFSRTIGRFAVREVRLRLHRQR